MLNTTVIAEGLEFIFQRTPTEAEIATFSDSSMFATPRDAFLAAAESDAAAGTRLAVALYDGALDRLADGEGLGFWAPIASAAIAADAIDGGIAGQQGVALEFAQANEFLVQFAALSARAAVELLYNQILNRGSDQVGSDFWTAEIQAAADDAEAAALADGATALEAAEAAADARALRIADLLLDFIASEEYQAGIGDNITNFLVNGAEGTQDLSGMSGVALEDVALGDADTGLEIPLSDGQDALVGTNSNDTFDAPIVQASAGFGNVTNTIESGDSIDGRGGVDVLTADLTTTTTGGIPVGPAISPDLTSVENLFFRTQYSQNDILPDNTLAGISALNLTSPGAIGGLNSTQFLSIFGATIDAQDIDGVAQFWSDDARADIIVEDAQSLPIIGFRDSDPFVSYGFFVDPTALVPSEENSSLTLLLVDVTDPTAELTFLPVNGVTFTLGGADFAVTIPREDDMGNPVNDTYVDFTAALNAAIDATAGLEGVDAVLQSDGQTIVLTDANGAEFGIGTYTFTTGGIPGNRDFLVRQEIGEPDLTEIRATLVADLVGSGAEGGVFIVGTMGQQDGIENFDLLVGRDSNIQVLSSTNNILEEVIVDDFGSADGDLIIGPDTPTGVNAVETIYSVPTTIDDRVGNQGLTDVQTFDSTSFEGDVKIGARITPQAQGKYLNAERLSDEDETDEDGQIPFSYLFSDADNNLSLSIDQTVSIDPAFTLDIISGAGDDRFNLTGTTGILLTPGGIVRKDSIEIDGDRTDTPGDINTVELNTSTGVAAGPLTAAQNAFEGFEDIDRLVIAGNNTTTQDIDTGNMLGLSEIVIATGGPGTGPAVSTTIIDPEAGTSITVTGKNQTLGGFNNPIAAQNFATVSVINSDEVELGLLIENTATSAAFNTANNTFTNGDLNIANLTIGGPTSLVRSATLNSATSLPSIPNTVNQVTSFNGANIAALTLIGTQQLGVIIDSLGIVTAGDDISVDASALGETVFIGFDTNTAAMLDGGTDDVITGTTQTDDFLGFGGNLGGMVNGTNFEVKTFDLGVAPLVVDIENVVFGALGGSFFAGNVGGTLGGAEGVFSFGNVTGAPTVTIGTDVGGAMDFLALIGLSSGAVITVGDVPNTTFNDDLYFEGPGSGSFTLNLTSNVDNTSDITDGDAFIDISDFDTVALDISTEDEGLITMALFLDDVSLVDSTAVTDVGVVIGFTPDANGDFLSTDGTLDTLTVTGASPTDPTTAALVFEGIADGTPLPENAIPASVDTFDFSGYAGTVTATIQNTVAVDGASNATSTNDNLGVVVNPLAEFTVTLTEADPAAVDFNTTFVFGATLPTAQVGGAPFTYTVNNFLAFDSSVLITGDNVTQIDFTQAGINSFAQLDLDAVDANTVRISPGNTADADDAWELIVQNTTTGIAPVEITDENFIGF